MAVIDRLQLEVEMKDITNSEFEAELLSRGGEIQVPYLIDAKHGVAMYESDDIVAHLQKNYGTVTVMPKVRMHISDNACVSCEG